MEFNPNNNVIKLCVRGMDSEGKGDPEEANSLFHQAWNESTDDFEKFISAYFVSRLKTNIQDKLVWLKRSIKFALNINNETVMSAFPTICMNIARCYEDLNDYDNAQKYYELSDSYKDKIYDSGPFYHGTKAELKIGDYLTPGNKSNYQNDIIMNHIYFTALINGAGLAASLAKGDGRERVYIVEPTGSFENDPNVTDKKFPGNLTRSYRTLEPLKIIGEITDWNRLTPDEIKKWHEKIARSKGEIIN